MKFHLIHFIAICFLIAGVKSEIFREFESPENKILEPLRPKTEPKVIKECGLNITDPYGILIQNFTRDTSFGTRCNYTLQAPENHVVHFMKISYHLLDENPPSDWRHSSIHRTHIYIYDTSPVTKAYSQMFYIDCFQLEDSVRPLNNSISTNNKVLTQVLFNINDQFNSQNVEIIYEFIDKQKMDELLAKHEQENTKS